MLSSSSTCTVDSFRTQLVCHSGERGGCPADVLRGVIEVEAQPAAGRWVEPERTVRQGRAVTAGAGLDPVPVQAFCDGERADAGDRERDQWGALVSDGGTVEGEALDLAERLESLGGQGPGVAADAGHRLLDDMARQRVGGLEVGPSSGRSDQVDEEAECLRRDD